MILLDLICIIFFIFRMKKLHATVSFRRLMSHPIPPTTAPFVLALQFHQSGYGGVHGGGDFAFCMLDKHKQSSKINSSYARSPRCPPGDAREPYLIRRLRRHSPTAGDQGPPTLRRAQPADPLFIQIQPYVSFGEILAHFF